MAVIEGKQVLCGNEKLLKKNNIKFKACDKPGVVVYLAINGEYAGYVLISDALKENVKYDIDSYVKSDIVSICKNVKRICKYAMEEINENKNKPPIYAGIILKLTSSKTFKQVMGRHIQLSKCPFHFLIMIYLLLGILTVRLRFPRFLPEISIEERSLCLKAT